MKFNQKTVRGKTQSVGELCEDKIFRKRVSKDKHFFRNAGTYGIDESIMAELQNNGCTEVRLLELESNQVWSTPFEFFIEKSWTHSYPGFQEQRFMSKERWDIRTRDGLQIQFAKKDPPKISTNTLF